MRRRAICRRVSTMRRSKRFEIAFWSESRRRLFWRFEEVLRQLFDAGVNEVFMAAVFQREPLRQTTSTHFGLSKPASISRKLIQSCLLWMRTLETRRPESVFDR